MHPLEQLCNEYHISRYRLAKESGIKEQTLNKAIAQKTDFRKMQIKTIMSIAEALCISIDQLIEKLTSYE